MNITPMVAEINAEIERLTTIRDLMLQVPDSVPAPVAKKGPGRPKKTIAEKASAPVVPKKAKRNLTPEGRKKIAETMRKRWAEVRGGASAPNTPAKKAAKKTGAKKAPAKKAAKSPGEKSGE